MPNCLCFHPKVQRAIWGHPTNLSKAFDVTSEMQQMVDAQGGDRLYIGTDVNICKLFRDPVRGTRKKLTVSYVARCVSPAVLDTSSLSSGSPKGLQRHAESAS